MWAHLNPTHVRQEKRTSGFASFCVCVCVCMSPQPKALSCACGFDHKQTGSVSCLCCVCVNPYQRKDPVQAANGIMESTYFGGGS